MIINLIILWSSSFLMIAEIAFQLDQCMQLWKVLALKLEEEISAFSIQLFKVISAKFLL
ncbi:hypothetical protein RchiOBHm_Chr7g0186551 [Rosa chinensis]|uniref:Uncharacterized protein n=1 Tax=Rosa chinensis TaxID=74649 RepID=A0A2P6P415_ROSCH|nr:hypothetical protein RchiOBHm_Chr7g0186551 [Rosa chinensis]